MMTVIENKKMIKYFFKKGDFSNVSSCLEVFVIYWNLEMSIIRGICEFCLHLRNTLAYGIKNLLIHLFNKNH